jgi:hypothetical protein
MRALAPAGRRCRAGDRAESRQQATVAGSEYEPVQVGGTDLVGKVLDSVRSPLEVGAERGLGTAEMASMKVHDGGVLLLQSLLELLSAAPGTGVMSMSSSVADPCDQIAASDRSDMTPAVA